MNDRHCCTRRDALRYAFGGAGSLLTAGLLHELCAADEARQSSADPLAPEGAALPRQGQARHLPVPRPAASRTSIPSTPSPSCSPTTARPSTIDEWQGKPGKYNSLSQKAAMGLQARTASAAPRSATCSRTSAGCVDDLCVIRSMQVGPHEPLRGDAEHAHRVVHVRPAEHRRLGQLRPRHGQPQPAVVRGAGAGRALRRRPDVGRRLPARLPPGDARRARPDADRRPRPPRRLAAPCRSWSCDAARSRPTATTSTAGRATPSWRRGCGRSRRPTACRRRRRRRSTCRRRPTRRWSSTACSAAATTGFAWQCLVARRLAERGVRFIELIDVGSSNNWDAHGDMMAHAPLAKNVDQPIAGLLTDLKRRGMLDDTLVVWTHRVRPDAVQRAGRRQGPRASPLGLLVAGWPAAASRAASSTAPPTSTASTSPRTRSTSTTSTPRSCTCWAWTTRS